MEEKLAGGFVNTVVRKGDTVLRTPGDRAEFVHDLLGLLADWPGAPRYLGMDGDREILSFLDGYVAWEEPRKPAVHSPGCLRSVGRLVREFHDLTAGTSLAGDEEVVCHNDLSPKNTVYSADGTRATAFIDWDIAAPGPRIHDLAFICWQYAEPGTPQYVASQWRALLDGYGPADTQGLVDTILWWQTRTWQGIESAASIGDSAMTRLVDLGVPAQIRESTAWITTHSAVLAAELGEGGVG
ncbi:phosphotransferase [Kribbella sancticallisti]|uniref:Phosphotransferase n=1 Tax=Kribbella sancticallisti TaxID=460087 RepID=A0ABN2EDE7_9ACTN